MSGTENKSFRESHSFEVRHEESRKILAKYDDRVPVIVERAARADNTIPDIDKKKFLVPGDLTLAQFLFVIRKRISLSAEKSLFVFVESQVSGKKRTMSPAASDSLADIYLKNKDDDGFLYITYTSDSTFG